MSYEGTHWSCGHECKDHCRCDERKVKAMTLDEDAAKVVNECSVPASPSEPCVEIEDRWKDELKRRVAAFGRRCAEVMREECAKVASDWHKLDRTHVNSNADMAYLIAQAIRQVGVK